MSRRFPLATVLRIRGIEEDLARGRLAGSVTAHHQASAATADAHTAYTAASADTGPLTRSAFLADRARRTAYAGSVFAASAAQTQAAEAVTASRAHWSEAAMRLAALERLAERAKEGRRQQVLAADQRTAEETSAALQSGRDPR
jgi:hypothetical protein